MSYLSGTSSELYFTTMLVIDCVQIKQTLCVCVHVCIRACMWPCVYVIFKQIQYFEVWSCWCIQVAVSKTSCFAFCHKYMVHALYHYFMFQVIETAFTALKTSTTDPFYRRQCWEVIRCFLVASLNLVDDKNTMQQLFSYPRYFTTILGCCKMWA